MNSLSISPKKVHDIFRLKMQRPSSAKCKSSANSVAKIFGVSPKTVRDIWKGRTWYRTTHQLEPNRAEESERLTKHSGRPRGVKDSKPRVCWQNSRRRKMQRPSTLGTHLQAKSETPLLHLQGPCQSIHLTFLY